MGIESSLLRQVIEAAIMAAGKPLTIAQLQALFVDETGDEAEQDSKPSKAEVDAALEDIQSDMHDRGFELKEVASGWRFQVKQDLALWVGRLWDEKPQKYSRALLETLALIAYRQPITRGEIEEIRGVAVSSHIIKTLVERNWVKVIGHKDVPGRPAMYATTKDFLDYFDMKSLEQLPTLAEIRDLDSLNKDLGFEEPSAGKEPSTGEEPSADEEPSVESDEPSDQQDFLSSDSEGSTDADNDTNDSQADSLAAEESENNNDSMDDQPEATFKNSEVAFLAGLEADSEANEDDDSSTH